MDKINAMSLLDKTFNKPYSQENFINFINELFNGFQVSIKNRHITEVYQEYIQGEKGTDGFYYYKELGEYTDTSRKKIDVLAIKLKRSRSVERARTMQRNFVAKHLAEKNKDAALVAFYGEDPEDWRFSFVKMEYHLEKTDSGRIKAVKDLTPAKRYSYLVGVNEPNHTCKKQFLNLIMEEKVNPSFDEIENAFSIEKITKEFFDKYKELFLELKEFLDKILEKDPYVREDFEIKSISTIDFAKKLLGQIVFLYFLQKKGWLGVERDEQTGKFREWETGHKKFLTKLFRGDIVTYNNFFKDILEPLFYTALAIQRDDDYYTIFNYKCKIPFLNGGLFEPIEGYNWKETELIIDNSIFEKIITTFDEFNFTVKEDEPLEKEVAVDPEMLGKVFENLLDVKDRKSKGAFYTPREIVHYMCQQSLIKYLYTIIRDSEVDISLDDIEKFIHFGDSSTSDDQRYLIEIRNLFRDIQSGKSKNITKTETQIKERISKLTLPDPIIKHKGLIDKVLAGIKVVDPAVGSGAFPVGMMNEIVKARSILTIFFDEKIAKERTNYNLKRDTIENSLYGVDIDPSAVDITKLRFWLSLVVDEEDIKNIQPLPNLDYKIMCGNSLLEDFEGIKLFKENKVFKQARIEEIGYKESKSHEKLRELKSLQKQFFSEQNKKTKKLLMVKIEEIEWELIEETLKESGNEEAISKLEQSKVSKSKPFFLWKLYFTEVFQGDNPGFDIVIANPPYVRQEAIKEYKEAFMRTFETYTSTADIYTYFYELGYKLLKDKGILTYISSNKWMRAKYGKKLREFLRNKTTILQIIDFGGYKVFETATVDTNILQFTKIVPNSNHKISFVNIGKNFIPGNLWSYFGKEKQQIFQRELSLDGYVLENNTILSIKNKMESVGIPLKELNIQINYGIKTGLNEAFIIDTQMKEKLCYEDPNSTKIIKPILRGRDINRYFYEWDQQWIIFIPWHFPLHNDNSIKGASEKAEIAFKEKYPAVYSYLLEYKEKLSQRNKEEVNIRYEWYALQRCAATYYQNFDSPKIIYPVIGSEGLFNFDNQGFYHNDKVFHIIGDDLKFLIAVLNSKLSFWYLLQIGSKLGKTGLEFRKIYVEKFPIPKISEINKSPYIKIVDQIDSITKSDDYIENPEKRSQVKSLEKDIDQLVYNLYELTPGEISIIENLYSNNS